MYSYDLGNIKSDGQLYNYERGYYEGERRDHAPPPPPPPPPEKPPYKRPFFGDALGFLRDVKLDDLLLLAIGALLLLDSDADSDTVILLVLALLIL